MGACEAIRRIRVDTPSTVVSETWLCVYVRGMAQKAMAQKTSSGTRRARGSISPDEIIAGAFDVANEKSLSGFSMPMLAKHLGVGVTSIYWYFRKKEDLLDAMADRANGEYHAATPFVGATDWKDALRRHFRRMREAFREQPVLIELTLLRPYPRPVDHSSMQATADKLDSMIGAMVEVGFSAEDALEIYLSLLAHVCGAAMVAHQGIFTTYDGGLPSGTADENASVPLLNSLAAKGHRIEDVEDTTFDFTLEAILAYAERTLQRD